MLELPEPVVRTLREIVAPMVEADGGVLYVVRKPNAKTGPGLGLRLHLAASGDLRAGRYDIQEPDAGAPGVAPGDGAVMVVPGLAFDAAGRRLGFGGGYYDELLAGRATGQPPFVVGFGYDFQVVDTCPADERDVRVDCVVTEARVIQCGAARDGNDGHDGSEGAP